jgi:hypothetical protein
MHAPVGKDVRAQAQKVPLTAAWGWHLGQPLEEEKPRRGLARPQMWLRILAYAIPLGFLAYVLYWNFLPLGYDQTFTVAVGAPGDTSGEFRLEPSRDLSAPKTAPDGSTYRELNGLAYAVFEPKAVLRNATITVSVEGDGVSLIPPYIDFDPASVGWDYSWDFEHNTYHVPPVPSGFSAVSVVSTSSTTPDNLSGSGLHGVLSSLANWITRSVGQNSQNQAGSSTTPRAGEMPAESGLVGNAFRFDNYLYFDGKSKMELPGTENMFESGPFTVYAEWTPEDPTQDFQEIIGHFNWELLQDKEDVKFQVGRMDNASGTVAEITYPIDSSFFNQRHSALASYVPASSSNPNGYIELYIDGNFVDRYSIGTSTIWADYNDYNNLTMGMAAHGAARNYTGKIEKIGITNKFNSLATTTTVVQNYNILPRVSFPITGNASSTLRKIMFHAQEH